MSRINIPYNVRLPLKDFFQGIALGTLGIQYRLRRHLKAQSKALAKEKAYTRGYFYQGLEELGITGAKPTGFRFRQYEVDEIITDAEVLDIGSNAGFVACYCARRASTVTAVEFNPYLNRKARDSARYLKLANVEVVEEDFSKFDSPRRYDVVL